MNRPNFTDPAAIQSWDAYFAEVDGLLRPMGDQGQELLGEELRTHLADGYMAQPGDSEATRLQAAIARLGKPADYLHPMVAGAILEGATRTYNPLTIAKGLFHSLLAGSRYAVIGLLFGIGYMLLAGFVLMTVLKPFWSRHVGLLQDASGNLAFGFKSNVEGTRDLLGWWSIPVSLAAAVLLYVVLTRALRRFRPGRHQRE
jgi:hypothetical protein